jgi:hypothetical protein
MCERIKCAAVWNRATGNVYEGRHHAECLQKAAAAGEPRHHNHQGFVTEEGVCVNRFEALAIAETAGQIVKKHPPMDRLLSEDLREHGTENDNG